jgi:hypothetical protein
MVRGARRSTGSPTGCAGPLRWCITSAPSILGRAPSVKAPELKVTAALHVVEVERRPLIWTDDDAIPSAGPQRRRLEAAGMPLLFLTPDPLRGLQPGDLTAIDNFLGASYSDATG